MDSIPNSIKVRYRIARENPLLWLSLILAIGTAAAVWFWPAPTIENTPSDFRVRTWGMVLQLIGAYTVWRDLSQSARRFGKASLLANTIDWAKRLIRGRGHVVSGSLTAQFNISGSGRGTIRQPTPPAGAPIEARIETLEYNLSKIDEELSSAFHQIAETETKLREQIVEESRKRDSAHKELQNDLHEAIVGNYAALVFGAFWVAIGIIISAWAPEIAKAVAGQVTNVIRAM